MNRKQRRMAQAQVQGTHKPMIQLDRAYTVEEAGALAIQAYNLKNFQLAVDIYNLIIAQAPNVDAYNNQGAVLHEMGRNEEALANLDKAITLNPDLAEVHNNRGNILQKLRRYPDSLASYDKAIALRPSYADAHNNRGNTLSEMKRFEEALVSYDKAIALNPDLVEAYNNRGNGLRELKQFDEALASFAKAIALKPNLVAAYNNRSTTLQAMKRYDDALVSSVQAIAINPASAEAYNNQGMTLQAMKRFEDALASFAKAITLKPDMAEAYNNVGNTLAELKQYDEACAIYAKAIAIKPDYADVFQNRGCILRNLKRFDEALASFEKAFALNPDLTYLMGDLLHTKMHLCDWQGMDAVFNTLVKGVEAGKPVSNSFSLLPTAASAMQQRKCAENYVKINFPLNNAKLWNGERYAHDKIRIGYFSADFHNHPVSYLMAELFEIHDRSRFEVTAFSFGPPSADPMRKRLEKAFDRFIDVNMKTDLEIATLAKNMEIDIAIDLGGFTQNSRAGIFALRPAPVQVNYLGYPGTMGAGFMDYLIADRMIIPEEHKSFYSEKIVHLPHSYWVADSKVEVSEKAFTRQQMGLPENGFVFCCFNNYYKITPDVFAIWMQLLQQVEGSTLWLFGGNATSVDNLRAAAKAKGIAEHRLVFAKRMDDIADHLARQRCADLFLDTFYYNAHTTASDALWAGLPVVTCLGHAFAGRVAASLLHTIGLPELITRSHGEYEALALELARNPERLATIKAKLAQNRLTSPLFNTALFAKHIEAAYTKMWEKAGAGAAPDHIYVATP